MQNLREAVATAIKEAGNGATLARKLGLTRQAVYQWERVPSDRVLEVEAITGVSRTKLRPDLYPQDRERESASS